ncbi:hypothetical protein AB0I28_14390 [Phytomonospora sp. NPDC050363]|uniref:hypothetical protein n=1 Tax=Phytomonospora sp. NPDC050363 TaxID=3155642 RepID=UPI0033DBC1D9
MSEHEPVPTDTRSRRGFRDRLTFLLFRTAGRLKLGVASAYLAAASLIGFEALVGLLSFTSIWPASVPFVIGALAVVYFLRERIRAPWRRRSRD